MNYKFLVVSTLSVCLLTGSSFAIVESQQSVKKSSFWSKMFKRTPKTNMVKQTVPVVEDKQAVNAESRDIVTFQKDLLDKAKDEKTLLNAVKINGKVEYTNDVHSKFTLEDCIKIAVEHNPVIRSAVYNAVANKTKIGQAWSAYFPTLSVSLDGHREGNKYSNGMEEGIYNTAMYLPSISGEMLLFDFGKTKANADMAHKNYEAKNAKTMEEINTLICDLKTSYFNVLFAQAQVNVYTDTVSDYQLQLDRAVSFYNAGKKARIDVINAEYNLGKAQLNLVKAQNVYDVSRVKLAKIMGIPEYKNYELLSQLGTLKYDIDENRAIQIANKLRPELIASQKTLEAAKLNVRANKRNYTPNLGMFASYGNGQGNEFDVMSYKFGLSLKYSSFNAMNVKKKVDQAVAEYERAKAEHESVEHDIYLNVTEAYLDMKTNEEAILISKLALDQAKEQYRQSSGRYQAGVADFIELKDGETTYLNARLDFYNALLNYNNSAAYLEREIGSPIANTTENVLGQKK